MIEVERKFNLSKSDVSDLLDSAEFVSSSVNKDIYYDYSDYKLLKSNSWLRLRNDLFELKVKIFNQNEVNTTFYKELVIEKEIIDYLQKNIGIDIKSNLSEYVSSKMQPIASYDVTREKYIYNDFSIDIDKTSFGYNMIEIELLVEHQDHINNAQERILNLASEFNLNISDDLMLGKASEYIRRFSPDVYKDFLG